jgi:L-arabinose isomerase
MKTVQRRRPLSGKAGLIGVGHHTYWGQFDGLLEEMHRKMGYLEKRLEGHGLEVVNLGLVDDAESTYAAIPHILAADVDVLFIDMVTYATSSTFGVICREIGIPIVLVALQPLKAMDYENGSTYMQLCNDDFCSISEFTGVAIRMGRKAPAVILGYEGDDPVAAAELERWAGITHALHDLRKGRMGLMGHTLEAMLDMHCDPTAVTAFFGCHVPLIEPHDLMRHFEKVDDEAADRWRQEIIEFFDTPDPGSDPIATKLTKDDLDMAAKTAVALEALIAEKNLTGLAYYYEGTEGTDMRRLVTNLIVGNSLLTGSGFPMCGEYDIKTCIAMLIMDRLGIGGSFAEFHPLILIRIQFSSGTMVRTTLISRKASRFFAAWQSTTVSLAQGPRSSSNSRRAPLPCSASARKTGGNSSLSSPRAIPNGAPFRQPETRIRMAASAGTCGSFSSTGWPLDQRITLPSGSVTMRGPLNCSPIAWESNARSSGASQTGEDLSRARLQARQR